MLRRTNVQKIHALEDLKTEKIRPDWQLCLRATPCCPPSPLAPESSEGLRAAWGSSREQCLGRAAGIPWHMDSALVRNGQEKWDLHTERVRLGFRTPGWVLAVVFAIKAVWAPLTDTGQVETAPSYQVHQKSGNHRIS